MPSVGFVKLLTYPKPDLSIAAINKAFPERITRRRVPLQYGAALAGTAFAMLMLPVIYLAIVGLAMAGVFAYATHNTGLLRLGTLGYLLYFPPLVAALPVLLILVRPLMARTAKAPELLILKAEEEPRLFALVAKVCETVGAPMPSQIDVDCEPNAGAALKRLFFGKELALTIGLPLATCLDARQFSGILAHEFAHFAQGTGMRFTGIIRHVSARLDVATARDADIDARLERNANKRGLTGVVFKAINACIWLVRSLLDRLAYAGREVSCLMLRQMEFDADSYEIKLIGSEAFEETTKRLFLIKAAAHDVSLEVARSWGYKRLPDNLPALVQRRSARTLAPEGIALLARAFETDTTERLDTHPSDAARLFAARALNEPGLLTLEGPAAALFSDLESLCKKATRHEYKHKHGYEFGEGNMVPIGVFAEKSRYYEERAEAMGSFLGDVGIWFAPLFADAVTGPWSRSASSPFPQWRHAREMARRRREEAEAISEECRENEARIIELTKAIVLLNARISVDTEVFGLQYGKSRKANARFAADERDKCRASRARLFAGLEPFLDMMRERVLRAVDILAAGEVESIDDRRVVVTELRRLIALSARLELHWRTIQEMVPDISAAEILRNFQSRAPDPDEVDGQLADIATRLTVAMKALRDALADISDLDLGAPPAAADRDAAIASSASAVEAFTEFHVDTVGRLFVIINRIEARLDADIRAAAMMRAQG
ncbi:MAG: M48 family metalloprotease [Hyphomicrobiales bacterium]